MLREGDDFDPVPVHRLNLVRRQEKEKEKEKEEEEEEEGYRSPLPSIRGFLREMREMMAAGQSRGR
jgi:hypothetical protein